MCVFLLVSFIIAGGPQGTVAEEPHTLRGKTVEGWLAVLRDKASTEVQRRHAVVALGCFGPEANVATPELTETIRNAQLADEAATALAEIGTGAEAAVPILIRRFLERGSEHLTGLGEYIFSNGSEESLVHVGGPAVPALLRILDGQDWAMRVCAAGALGRIGPAAGDAVPSLVRAIERVDRKLDADPLVTQAIGALGRIGPKANAARLALSELLTTDNGCYYFDAVLALRRIGAPPVRKLVEDFLREADPGIADALARLGPEARDAIPALRAALTDRRLQVRLSAAATLAHIDPTAIDSIPVLIEGLKNWNDRDLDVDAVPWALARLGPGAKAALPAMIGIVKQRSGASDLLVALVEVDPGGGECVPALIAALKSDDREFASAAAHCLGVLGPRAKDAVPALATALTRDFPVRGIDSEYEPQASAAKALRRIGPEAKPAIPSLIRALAYREQSEDFGPDDSAAVAAAQALGSFGGDARAAVPALVAAVRTREKDDQNWFIRKAAALALGEIRPDGKAAISVLRDVMKEFDDRCPFEVIIGLYRLAPNGEEIAELWLKKHINNRRWLGTHRLDHVLQDRAMVLGAMRRTDFEADWLTLHYLEQLDTMIADADPGAENNIVYLESWLELFGNMGTAGRRAIPRLNEFRKHPHPWVRMWASEALARILPKQAQPE
jgi:HEAT repeat protein